MSDDDSENEVETLLKTKAEMEVKLKEAQKKLMEQKMDNKARRFQDHIAGGIRDFRVVIMDCFDSSRLDERLVRASRNISGGHRYSISYGVHFQSRRQIPRQGREKHQFRPNAGTTI